MNSTDIKENAESILKMDYADIGWTNEFFRRKTNTLKDKILLVLAVFVTPFLFTDVIIGNSGSMPKTIFAFYSYGIALFFFLGGYFKFSYEKYAGDNKFTEEEYKAEARKLYVAIKEASEKPDNENQIKLVNKTTGKRVVLLAGKSPTVYGNIVPRKSTMPRILKDWEDCLRYGYVLESSND